MSESASPGPPSAAAVVAPADPFASAKANIRDTVKWLATTFAGLAAVVLAGTSLTGISHLKGGPLAVALIGCGFGLVCVIAAAGVMIQLLTSDTFFVSDLNTETHADLRSFLDAHVVDILPPQLKSVEALLAERAHAMRVVSASDADPESEKYKAADRFLTELVVPLSRLTNLAQFEYLRRNLKAAEPKLFVLAIGALIGLGVFAVFTGTSKDTKSDAAGEGPVMQFIPGANFGNVAGALAKTCGDKTGLKAQWLGSPQPGWANLRILAPEPCAGMLISIPTTVVPQG